MAQRAERKVGHSPIHGLRPAPVELVDEAHLMRDAVDILHAHPRTAAGSRFDFLERPHEVLGLVLILDHSAIAHQGVRRQLTLYEKREFVVRGREVQGGAFKKAKWETVGIE